jgi:hypothetical protein
MLTLISDLHILTSNLTFLINNHWELLTTQDQTITQYYKLGTSLIHNSCYLKQIYY